MVSAPRIRIFLAEDDREMRQMIAVTLRRDGHLVVEAPDGTSLVRDLVSLLAGQLDASQPLTPTLIITDVRMPGLDGLSMLKALRHHPRCPAFILVTGFGDPELHAEATALGALRVFDKPFDLDSLRTEVAAFQVASAVQSSRLTAVGLGRRT